MIQKKFLVGSSKAIEAYQHSQKSFERYAQSHRDFVFKDMVFNTEKEYNMYIQGIIDGSVYKKIISIEPSELSLIRDTEEATKTHIFSKYLDLWLKFIYNYPENFIEDAFEDSPIMAKHFKEKFESYKASSIESMIRLFLDMTDSNREKIIRYIIKTYNHEKGI